MSDRDDSVLDKAETIARRVLERLGAKLDSKLHSEDKTLSHQAVGDLAARIENSVESCLQPDKNGIKRVAPNCIEVLLTYEEASEVTDQYLEALAGELKITILEYLNNRRYHVPGPIQFKLRRDLFTKCTTINVSFDPQFEGTIHRDSSNSPASAVPRGARRTVHLTVIGAGDHLLNLGLDEAPRSIGRAAGNAIRIDDESVSRLHCSIALRTTGEIVVSDLGSANGTSVNGRPLASNEARAVAAGDVIAVGDVKITVTGVE
jgi:hypothetical protein